MRAASAPRLRPNGLASPAPVRVRAVRFVNVRPAELAMGGTVQLFTFEVVGLDGVRRTLRQRYSSLRLLDKALERRHIDELPAFPTKSSFTRQTAEFLEARGHALGRYLNSVLTTASLASTPELVELLQAASTDDAPQPVVAINTTRHVDEYSTLSSARKSAMAPAPAAAPAAAPSTPTRRRRPPPPAQPPRAPQPATRAPATAPAPRPVRRAPSVASPAAATLASSSPISRVLLPEYHLERLRPLLPEWGAFVCAFALTPMGALALCISTGYAASAPLLAICCCLLGMASGMAQHRIVAAAPPAALGSPPAAPAAIAPPQHPCNGSYGSSSSQSPRRRLPLDDDARAAAVARRLRAVRPPPLPRRVRTAGGARRVGGTRGSTRGCVRFAIEHSEADGWYAHSEKQGVQIFLNATRDAGCTHCLGVGDVDAPASVLCAAMNSDELRPTTDKQWLKTTTLATLPPSAMALGDDEWEVFALEIETSTYKSVAPPFVAARDAFVVKAKARHTPTGRTRAVMKSLGAAHADALGCTPPRGYVRVNVICGGFDAVPIDADRCEMRYVNMVDPNGRLPSSVVAITVPDRAMAVARARLIVADRSQWAQLEAAGP